MPNEKESPAVAPTPMVVIASDEHARRELAKELKELKKNPLDRTVPGGKFRGTDGKLRDAFGNEIREDGEPDDPDAVEAELKATEAKLAELRSRATVARGRAESTAATEAAERRRRLAAGEVDEDAHKEEAAGSAKTKTAARR